jgi:hypothetical protein
MLYAGDYLVVLMNPGPVVAYDARGLSAPKAYMSGTGATGINTNSAYGVKWDYSEPTPKIASRGNHIAPFGNNVQPVPCPYTWFIAADGSSIF